MKLDEIKETEIIDENQNDSISELKAIRAKNAELEKEIRAKSADFSEPDLLEEEKRWQAQLQERMRRINGEPDGGESDDSDPSEIIHATDDYLPPSEAIKKRYAVKDFPIDRKLAYTFYERQTPKEKRKLPIIQHRLNELAEHSAKMAEVSRSLESSEFINRGGFGVERARNWMFYRDHEREIIKNTAILNIIPLFSEVEIHEKTRQKLNL